MDHRQMAVSLFNRTWDYIEQPHRSAQDDLEMIHCAHASRYHWGVAGGPLEWARGEWQISRVYSLVGKGESALYHAQQCYQLTENEALGLFDLSVAHEVLARAYRVLGQPDLARQHVETGLKIAHRIVESDDRTIALQSLKELSE